MKIMNILFLTLMLLLGCKSDPCDEVDCVNGAICVEGICDCASGYEGTLCDLEMRSNFYGTWFGSEFCSDDEFSKEQTIVIEPGDDIFSIVIRDTNSNESYVATLDPDVIDAYAFEYKETDSEGNILSSLGDLEDGILKIFSSVEKESDTTTCIVLLVKQ